ncbi:MAG: hypothetical protein Q3M24_10630 [Candidatus Electrothrix aestuarii]|uniref:Uncharacterized protein n=1 Tax=Candidatus Electrothrix aestuarii TaxID=3062594 RepID=A0AAU8M251_9BACT|nr:hypothetical protein [Candidatus Electrothrix aestuarii]WPD24130.1 MAG: hypothetical protein SD837_06125 [Candidatus Electrothrix sp. GW3-3]
MKNYSELLDRIKMLEDRLDDIEEFGLDEKSDISESLPYKVVFDQIELVSFDGQRKLATSKTFVWKSSWINGMHAHSSKFIIYDTGLYESVCDIENSSRYRKHNTYISFYLLNDKGEPVSEEIDLWAGNFSPGQRKQYTTSGHNDTLRDLFTQISSGGKIQLWRSWTSKKRN